MSAGEPGRKHIPATSFILPIILFGLAMFAALVVSYRDGREIVDQYVPLQDAVMLVKNDISLFRLSIEQHYFNPYEQKDIDWKRLDHAELVADAMVKGGSDGENIYVPLQDPEFMREVALFDSKLYDIRRYAEQMAVYKGAKENMDEPLDAALEAATVEADHVEAILHKVRNRRLSEFNFLSKGLTVFCLLFTAAACVIIARFGRIQSRDIAALTASEARLRENERKLTSALEQVMLLSSAVEASPDVFHITDIAGDIIYSNKSIRDIYGYSPEEFAGRNVSELSTNPDFAVNVVLPALKNYGSWSGEVTVRHRDGHTFPIWLTTSLIRDEAGEPAATVGVVRDITARKLAEEELKRFKFILDNAGEEVYIIEPSGRYAYMNNTAMKNLGYTPSEIPGLKISDIAQGLTEKEWPEHFNRHKTQMLSTGDVPPFEVVHITKDGRLVPKEAKPVYIEVGGKEYICSFLRDISERKKLEQYKSDFYAMITHDLKSPLTTVLACAYLLLERSNITDDDDMALLNSMKNSGEKMVSLVEDFLTFERAESGKLVPHLVPTDVSEVITDICADLCAQAEKKGLALTVEHGDGLPRVNLDRKQAERAIRNLIGNALAYTPRGGRVDVGSETVERDGGSFLEVSVSDTGPGIPRDELGKIFNKYYRSPRTSGTKGSGLGLAIVEAIAKAHGGRVEVDSEPGKGSTFRLLFPILP